MGKKYDQEIFDKLSIEYLIDGKSLSEIEKTSGISRQTLSRNFKKMGIDIINNQNMIKFNQYIFDEIDSEEKAYWLGFIYADGYISCNKEKIKNHYGFELSLKLSDKEHLEKFSKFIEYNNLVKCDNYRARCAFSNKHLWTVLNDYGCTPRKSLTLEFPNENIFKSKDLIRHFIRGYFDGDGCISYHKRKEIISSSVSIIGTKEFLLKVDSLSINNNVTMCHDKRHSNDTFSLQFKKQESIDFINFIYNNSNIYLNRKYKLYLFFKNGCRSLTEFNELLQTNIGEDWDVNPEINLEVKTSESS